MGAVSLVLLIAVATFNLAVFAALWAWLIRPDSHNGLSTRPLAIIFSAAFVLSTMWAAAVLAHGDAAWIMANPRYVDRDGVHCCGPADCRREHAAKFRETPAGVEIVTGAGDVVLMPRHLVGQGLYPSIDQDWWVCVRGGVVRCVFKPTTGG